MTTDLIIVPSAPLAFTVDILAGQLAPSSVEMYRRDFAAYGTFAHSSALDVTDPATLARWRTHLAADTQLSPATINRMLSAVKRLMREAATQRYTSHEIAQAFDQVPGVKVRALRERQKTHSRTRISQIDMRRICTAPDDTTPLGKRDRALLATMASSGLRVSEIATLTIGQIEARGRGYIVTVVGKTDTVAREAHLSTEAYRLIMDWISVRPIVSQYVFTASQGRGDRLTDKPMTSVAVWLTVQRYADVCDLSHIKPHDFRRFVGTQLAAKDIRKAQKALGHKSIETTAKHYVLDELEPGETDNLY